jgi:hypothetical protein
MPDPGRRISRKEAAFWRSTLIGGSASLCISRLLLDESKVKARSINDGLEEAGIVGISVGA